MKRRRKEKLVTRSDSSQDEAILSLHRYFIGADRMRRHFKECVLGSPTASQEFDEAHVESVLYMGYWYAGLYVVIEGWQELRLSDPAIDALLKSSNVGLLKRYRNGIFHFQRNYFDERFLNFVNSQGVVAWVHAVTDEFGRWFLDWFKHKAGGE